MGLREIAEADLAVTLEDGAHGFGWPVVVTAPDGTATAEGELYGQTDDIAQVIDPDTGQPVSGRLASVVLRISSLTAALPGQGLPRNVPDRTRRPWVVRFLDINGAAHVFKVRRSAPDRALGVVVCILEAYSE